MRNKKNVPGIRFKGFADEWNNEALGKLATFSKGRGYSKGDLVEKGTPIVLYGRLYTKYQTVISDVDTFAIQKKDSVLSKGIEVVVPASGETAEDISRASVIIKPNTIIAGDLNIIYPNSEMDSVFLALSISNGDAQKNLSKKAQGKSVVHLHNSDLDGIELKYPVVDEQKAIGNYFQNIDRLINTSQTKLDKLKNIKKACLEKMFPRNDSTTPELRFKGFSEEWKNRAIKDIANDFYGGGTPRTSIERYWNGIVPWIQTSDLKEDQVFGVVPQKYISDSSIKESATKLVPENSIAIITRVGVGKLSLIPFKYATSQDFLSISKLKIDEYFAAYTIHRKMQTILKEVQGTSIKGITKEELLAKKIETPAKAHEQQSIGKFFTNLDDLITKTEQQINKLENIKKACLDKMFVNTEDKI